MTMKTAGAITILRLMISCLLVAITASGFVSGEKEIVLDNLGNPVEFHAPYHAYFKRPGADALFSRYGSPETSGFSCPQRVVLIAYALVLPIINSQVTFIPTSSDSDVVRVSTELKIRFAFPNHCEEYGYWRAADSSLPIKEIVMTGSESSNDTTFTIKKIIKKSGISYQFALGSADKPTDIGLDYLDSGVQRLILSNYSDFNIRFVPAPF
ncbi:hypothetical protein HA466_0253610 [Hirschfeldia incana]|nr:hypothetical protein HA466_0253610 [Hirschfeldia incana]